MNRALSVRSRKGHENGSSAGGSSGGPKHRFTMSSLRGMQQSDLSKRLYKLIKSENHAIASYESASKERMSIAVQLSEWGQTTGDDAVSDISDKLGVLLSEIAEQEDQFASNLEEYRGILKQIRNTEQSVQPSRDHKAKVSDEIQKLKYKEPESTKIVTLEQELVRAEAQALVAEAQLTNVTRQKLKEAYAIHLAAIIERSEKQAILARHARQVISLLDDTPIVPGDAHPEYKGEDAGREILNEAEQELRSWTPRYEEDALAKSQHAGLSTNGLGDGHSHMGEESIGEVQTNDYEKENGLGPAEDSTRGEMEGSVEHTPPGAYASAA
ncbi:sphingolipid long chain base-responsive protein PIL1 [Aulographum hederae CBS 113979]|uniref:Sphingolipid long chain base-responsive protein PIL1 n=1 Tax=Aulographum hederae CBS 113979 TaxID=1176131 RepID=A0A6G1GX76_9PEZI|nr:sphingolipid long chain base-responsive protein PIL1 [Aulographum hederae CBS 113979]